MRIKSKDIAKALKLSEGTVSLALNDRPGVNAETKRKVLQYLESLEEQNKQIQQIEKRTAKGAIVLLNYIKHDVIFSRNAKKNPIIPKIEEEVYRSGYQFIYIQFHEQWDSLEELFEKCRLQSVKGLYIMAAEMNQSDIYPFLNLKVPIVVGDNLFYDQDLDCFLVDNWEGIRRGVDYLVDKGHSHIIYLAENIDIFNFAERREAFVLEMAKRECGDANNRIWHLGNSVEDVYLSMEKYLDKGLKKTTAFILESWVISLGVSKALMERKIRIPRDISMVGFDALPPDSLMGFELTLVKGTHSKRHMAAIQYLLKQVEGNEHEIIRIYYKTHMREGNSVFDKTKYIYP